MDESVFSLSPMVDEGRIDTGQTFSTLPRLDITDLVRPGRRQVSFNTFVVEHWQRCAYAPQWNDFAGQEG